MSWLTAINKMQMVHLISIFGVDVGLMNPTLSIILNEKNHDDYNDYLLDCGTKAEADAKSAKRANIVFIIVLVWTTTSLQNLQAVDFCSSASYLLYVNTVQRRKNKQTMNDWIKIG
jgi:hypothetical protein